MGGHPARRSPGDLAIFPELQRRGYRRRAGSVPEAESRLAPGRPELRLPTGSSLHLLLSAQARPDSTTPALNSCVMRSSGKRAIEDSMIPVATARPNIPAIAKPPSSKGLPECNGTAIAIMTAPRSHILSAAAYWII